MREVAVVSWAQSKILRRAGQRNEVELLMPPLEQVKANVGLKLHEIDFVCSGSSDYLQGAAFAFVQAVDSLGAVPPIRESHVEMDAAWALYEAWLKIQTGEADTALIFGFSKASTGDLPTVLSLQLDPYYLTPLWPDAVSLAALQARAAIDAGVLSEQDMAQVVRASRHAARFNPNAQLSGEYSIEQLLEEPYHIAPLRRHDCAPISDGASAMIIAAAGKAEELCETPVWIRGIDHRIESSHLGARDLSVSVSTQIAAAHAGVNKGDIDLAEIYAPFSHQQYILSQALGLGENTIINPSGGVLTGNVMMAAGLDRIGAAARFIMTGDGRRAVAHATSGPCLQQNLVIVLEA